MLNDFNCNCTVYMACGYTDLRRGIDGLATIVEQQFKNSRREFSVTCIRDESLVFCFYLFLYVLINIPIMLAFYAIYDILYV